MHLAQNFNLLFCMFVFGSLQNADCDGNLKDYLLGNFDFITNVLNTRNIYTRDAKSAIDIIDEKSIEFPDDFKNPIAYTAHNQTYLLIDHKIYRFEPGNNTLAYVAPSKLSQFEEKVAFVKTVDYNTGGLIFIAFQNGVSMIYGYSNETTEHHVIQSIQSPNKLTDAKFFFNNGSLYLVVSSMLGVSLSPVTVYKWMGTHFDRIAYEFIEGSVQLETFKNEHSEIIIVLRNNGVEKSNSYVYEFKSDRLRKFQILESSLPNRISTFVSSQKRYIIIFDERSKSALYRWDESELVPMHYFANTADVKQIIHVQWREWTLVVAIYKDQLAIYMLQLNELHLLNVHKFQRHFASIINVTVREDQYQEPDTILILGLDNSSKLIMSRIMFMINDIPTVGEVHDNNELIECMDELEEVLINGEGEMEIVAQRATKIIKTNEPLEYNGRLNVAAPVLAQFANIESPLDSNVNMIVDEIKVTEERIASLIQQIEALTDEETTVINGNLKLLGGLNTFKLESKRTNARKVNGINWIPQNWLSYSKEQIISSSLNVKRLHVKKLVHTNIPLFKDLLLSEGNQKLTASLELESLKTTHLYAQKVNGIPLHNIYLRGQPVRVIGNKTFNNIQAEEVEMELLNGNNATGAIKRFGDPKGMKYDFLPEVQVENLTVETINGVDWKEFSSGVFRIGSSQVIEGDLKFKTLKTNALETKFLSKIEVDKLFTTSSDQTVDASISFGLVDAKEVVCKTVNGLDFEKDVARFGDGENTVIKGPVSIKKLKIRGDLNMTGSPDKQNHIVGTNEADLLQIYNNKVKITGNLHLQNVYLPHSAKLFVGGNEFNQGNFDEYWLKTTNQDIQARFTAQMGITTPHLSTAVLNNIPVEDYMVNNLDDKRPTDYVFRNVTVAGNVFINDKSVHTPDLKELDENAVKSNGSFVIRGTKEFSGKVNVYHLKTDSINSAPTSNFHTVYSKKFSGTNKFKTLIIEGDVNTTSISSSTINGVDLNDLYDSALFIDAPIESESMDFVNATVDNLFTTRINNQLFSDYRSLLDQLYSLDTFNLVRIRGSAVVNNINNADYINDIKIADKIKRFQEGDANYPIRGNVNFEGKVRVKNLFIANMNGIDFMQLLPRLFYRDWPQNITTRHTFKVVTTRNLMSPMINDIDILHLVDTKSDEPQRLTAPNGLHLVKPKFSKSLNVEFLGCDVVKAFRSARDIPTRSWNSVKVSGNATVLNDGSNIGNLVHNAVRNNKENVIKAPVSLSHVYAEEVLAKEHINGIDLQGIIDDALFVNVENQTVTGFKTFRSLKVSSAEVRGNAEIPTINDLDMAKVNNSIIDGSHINDRTIKGRKTFFSGLEVDEVFATTAAGVVPENLVSLNNLKTIPNSSFDTLVVQESLNLTSVNNQNFDAFINNRLLLNSKVDQVAAAVYFFDELELMGPSTITSINDIAVDDIVFDEGIQFIEAPKKFKTDVEMHGDVIVDNLNGFEVDELYNNAIMFGEEANIQGSVRLNEVSQITGNIMADKINDIPVDLLKDQLQTHSPQIRANIVQDTIKSIESLIEQSVAIIQRLPDQYLYLEKSDKLQVEVRNSVDADFVQIKGNLMAHVKTEEAGVYCGLPKGCACPNQFTFIVSPEHSINPIDNKYGQRVFSYQDEEVTIHAVANSWSSSSNCRTNVSTVREFTTLTWSAHTFVSINQTVYPEPITGYISDVKFFSHDRQVYAVLSRFYDPILNTHNLDCLVVRFCKLKGTIELVKTIPTIAASNLHIFFTAQGINLVIANQDTNPSCSQEVATNIYRFNPTTIFELLRKIPGTGCLSVTSLVLGYDSLIVLAQRNAPLQTLKFDPVYDNYYFYQNMLLEHQVVSVSAFYTGDIGISDGYLTTVADNGQLHVFSYQHLAGWKRQTESRIEGLKALIPFTFNKIPYLFAASVNGSSVLTIVKHGFH